jgi:hypothetical protein
LVTTKSVTPLIRVALLQPAGAVALAALWTEDGRAASNDGKPIRHHPAKANILLHRAVQLPGDASRLTSAIYGKRKPIDRTGAARRRHR